MATHGINMTITTGIGRLHIYTDPAETKKAWSLLQGTPNAMYNAYAIAAQKYGGKIVKMARECINRDQPPKGASWPPLSDKYKERYHTDGHYFLSGQYYEAIGIYMEKVAYAGTGKFAGYKIHVGLPTGGKMHYHKSGIQTNASKSGEGRGDLSMLQLGNLLEYGFEAFGKYQVPARPLWTPLYAQAESSTGNLKSYITKALRSTFENFVRTGRWDVVQQAKSTAASSATEKSTFIHTY